MSAEHEIRFPGSSHAAVRLPRGAELSRHLTVENSPILFGCRTGICGTCLVEVTADASLPAPDEDEREVLDVIAEGNERARLCCQIDLQADVAVTVLEGE